MFKPPAIVRSFGVVIPAGVLDKAEVYSALREVPTALEEAGDLEGLVATNLLSAAMSFRVSDIRTEFPAGGGCPVPWFGSNR